DGKGPTAGAEILGGRYTASGITPGKNHVRITAAPKELVRPMDPEEAMKLKGKMKFDSPVPDATGNNELVHLEPGRQTRDFPLTAPPPDARPKRPPAKAVDPQEWLKGKRPQGDTL